MTRFWVTVNPNARHDDVRQEDGRVVAMVRAPARDGKANAAVLRLFAEVLGVPPSSVELARGASSRHKMLIVDGLDEGDVKRRIPTRERGNAQRKWGQSPLSES